MVNNTSAVLRLVAGLQLWLARQRKIGQQAWARKPLSTDREPEYDEL
jgi:hypothetical protein